MGLDKKASYSEGSISLENVKDSNPLDSGQLKNRLSQEISCDDDLGLRGCFRMMVKGGRCLDFLSLVRGMQSI